MNVRATGSRSRIRISLAMLMLAALAGGCANAGDGEDPPPGDPAPTPGPGAGDAEIQSIEPRSGGPGSQVSIQGAGFPPDAVIDVGFGPPESEYEVIAQVDAGAGGSVSTVVAVPAWAERARRYVFVLAGPDAQTRALASFHVTTEQGRVRVEGRITDEGVECVALRGPLEELYTLVGDVDELQPGDEVTVEGEIAEASICMQGTTLEVASVQRN